MKSTKISEYMAAPKAINSNANLTEAVAFLSTSNLSGVPVTNDQNEVVGFLSEQDCIKQMIHSAYYEDEVVTVRDVMNPQPMTMAPDRSLVDVAEIMIKEKIKLFPVCEDSKLVGIITRTNVLKALAEFRDKG